jgi:GDP-4-dehydro-6-deoxy-D-mannose reductase
MRVLVTGAAGFVGGHLLPRLEAEGWTVSASDREMDVSDPDAVETRVRDVAPDAIIHLAAVSSVATSWQQPELTYQVNYLGTRTVLEAALRWAPAARVILVSTADLYGSTQPGAAPFDETSDLRPHSPYARCKAAADLLGGVYAARGLDVIRVRPFNHTGPGQTDTFVLPSFARQVASIEAGRSEPTMRVGNLDSVRDFLDIGDVIDAYIHLLDPKVTSGTYNVASGSGIRVGDALRTLCSLAGVEPRIEIASEFFRPTDFAVGNAARLQIASGWQPRVPFDRTLERLLDYWRGRITAA